MAYLRWANLVLAALALLPPIAHVLELPNKLALDGTLWLAVQQHLYRGWGPFFGGPVEIGAWLTSLALLVPRRRDRRTRLPTLPANWASYRFRWEIGHALAPFSRRSPWPLLFGPV